MGRHAYRRHQLATSPRSAVSPAAMPGPPVRTGQSCGRPLDADGPICADPAQVVPAWWCRSASGIVTVPPVAIAGRQEGPRVGRSGLRPRAANQRTRGHLQWAVGRVVGLNDLAPARAAPPSCRRAAATAERVAVSKVQARRAAPVPPAAGRRRTGWRRWRPGFAARPGGGQRTVIGSASPDTWAPRARRAPPGAPRGLSRAWASPSKPTGAAASAATGGRKPHDGPGEAAVDRATPSTGPGSTSSSVGAVPRARPLPSLAQPGHHQPGVAGQQRTRFASARRRGGQDEGPGW